MGGRGETRLAFTFASARCVIATAARRHRPSSIRSCMRRAFSAPVPHAALCDAWHRGGREVATQAGGAEHTTQRATSPRTANFANCAALEAGSAGVASGAGGAVCHTLSQPISRAGAVSTCHKSRAGGAARQHHTRCARAWRFAHAAHLRNQLRGRHGACNTAGNGLPAGAATPPGAGRWFESRVLIFSAESFRQLALASRHSPVQRLKRPPFPRLRHRSTWRACWAPWSSLKASAGGSSPLWLTTATSTRRTLTAWSCSC